MHAAPSRCSFRCLSASAAGRGPENSEQKDRLLQRPTRESRELVVHVLVQLGGDRKHAEDSVGDKFCQVPRQRGWSLQSFGPTRCAAESKQSMSNGSHLSRGAATEFRFVFNSADDDELGQQRAPKTRTMARLTFAEDYFVRTCK